MVQKKTIVKHISINQRNNYRNKVYKSTIKTLIKKYLHDATIDINNRKELLLELSTIYSKLDKAVKRNIIHINNASRKKKKLSKILKQVHTK